MSIAEDLPLIRKVRKIFEKSKFDFVTDRVHFWIDGEDEELTEVDVCAIHGTDLFLMECKNGKLKNKNTELRRKKDLITAILSKSIQKISGDSNPKLSLSKLDDIESVYLGYCLGDEHVYKNHRSSLESKKILVWNNDAITYFDTVSETLGNPTRNEILFREFKVIDQDTKTQNIPAIKFKQGNLILHLFTLDVSDLLKIAYVSRRGTKRDESYQRIINSDRLESLHRFIIESQNLIMANPIILAFDPEIFGRVKYVKDGIMEFTNVACSAWIIDGQHRIFAFRDIDLGSRRYKKYNIKIPIVALEKSNPEIQSETFVNINYYQKKIESLLIYDLVAHFKYPRNELVWPSLLTMDLNENGVLQGLIKTKELERKKPNERKKPLQTTNFVRTILDELLGYNPNTDAYDGPLYTLSTFSKNSKISTTKNMTAFKIHSAVLQSYFTAVMSFTQTPTKDWRDIAEARGFLTSSAIKAFLLILATILRTEKKRELDFKEILKPLANIDFTKGTYATYRAGYPAINGYTKDLLNEINSVTGKKYEYLSIGQLRKKFEKDKSEKEKKQEK